MDKEKNTRILFLIDSLNGGGKERRLVQLIKGLNDRGFNKLHLVSLSDVNDYPFIINYNVNLTIIKRKIKWDPSMFLKLYRLMKKTKPDIVHSWSIMTSFYISLICKMLNIPHISGFVADCNPINKFSIYHFATWFPYKFADAIVGNSQAGLNAYKVPSEKAKVIYNGFEMGRLKISDDVSLLREKLNITTPYIITMAARFDKMKDFETFFEAAKKLLAIRIDITFLAIGKGELFNDFEKKVDQKNSDYIRMLGFRSDIDSIIKITDIGVLCTNPTYHAEGISNSLMEFMAFGKPVIATKGGGAEELISNNKNGFIITPRNSSELVSKINLLLNDKTLLTNIGNNAKATVETKFSLSKMTDTYIKLYNECLQMPPILNHENPSNKQLP